MKHVALFAFLAAVALPSSAQQSAFVKVRFGSDVQVELPRKWITQDKAINDLLNTSSEAAAKAVGIEINQGDNDILVSADTYDSAGNKLGNLRISLRRAPGVSQADLREIAKLPQHEIEAMIRPAADSAVKAVQQTPGVKNYRVTGIGIDTAGSLTCSRTSFEGEMQGTATSSTTWVCPTGRGTVKLSTMVRKSVASAIEPTLLHVRRTLSVPGGG